MPKVTTRKKKPAIKKVSRNPLSKLGWGKITAIVAAAVIGVVATSAIFADPAPMQIKSGLVANKCLDNRGGNVKKGNQIILYTCNKSNAQKWIIGGDGTIRPAFVSSTNPDLCIQPVKTVVNVGANGPRSVVGAEDSIDGYNYYPLSLQSCPKNKVTNDQRWVVNKSSSTITQKSTSNCMDVRRNSQANGAEIITYKCKGVAGHTPANNNRNQLWFPQKF